MGLKRAGDYIFEDDRALGTRPFALPYGRNMPSWIRLQQRIRLRFSERVRFTVLVVETLGLKGDPDALGKGTASGVYTVSIRKGSREHRVYLTRNMPNKT